MRRPTLSSRAALFAGILCGFAAVAVSKGAFIQLADHERDISSGMTLLCMALFFGSRKLQKEYEIVEKEIKFTGQERQRIQFIINVRRGFLLILAASALYIFLQNGWSWGPSLSVALFSFVLIPVIQFAFVNEYYEMIKRAINDGRGGGREVPDA